MLKIRLARKRKTARWLGIPTLLVVCILLVVGLVGYKIIFKPSRFSYGLAMGDSLDGMSQEKQLATLKHIKSLGFDEVRFNLDWNAIQPNNNKTYIWAASDILVRNVQRSGLNAIIILDRTPPWARPKSCTGSFFCAPAQPSDFATFAAAAAARYRGHNIAAWEIWNEPNIVNFWKPSPSPDQYTKVLKAAYQVIKRQNPSAQVLIGGLAGDAINESTSYIDARTFLSELYTDGAKNNFDGAAYHPYTSLRLPDTPAAHNGWPKLYETSPSIRSILVANNDQTKDVWITEVGAPTSGSGSVINDGNTQQLPPRADHVSDTLQAEIAQNMIQDLKKITWIKHLDWYTYTDSSSTSGGSYGLFQTDGLPKPAYTVFKTVL